MQRSRWTWVPETGDGRIRAAREAIRNVAEHAGAEHVTVRVQPANGSVLLTVDDDGVGFDPERREQRRSEGRSWPVAPRGARAPRGGPDRDPFAAGPGHVVLARGAGVIRLVVADDHGVVRAGLEQLVGTFEDVDLVGSAADGAEAVRLCIDLRPDVALVDLQMPSVDGIAATSQITRDAPTTKIVVLTSFLGPGAGTSARSTPAPSATSSRTPRPKTSSTRFAPQPAAKRRSIRRPQAPSSQHDAGPSPRGSSPSGRERCSRWWPKGCQQADCEKARDQREDRESASDERLSADRRDRSHASGALGEAARRRADGRVVGRTSDCGTARFGA